MDQQPQRYRAGYLVTAKQHHERWVWERLTDEPSPFTHELNSFVEEVSNISLYRIFRDINNPLSIQGGLRLGRFDDPFGEYGVLYVTSSKEAALAEARAPMTPSTSIPIDLQTAIANEWMERHHMRPGAVPHSWYHERSIAEISSSRLRLFRVSGESMHHLPQRLGLDGDLAASLTKGNFRVNQAVSRWLYESKNEHQEPAIDGIVWSSRYLPEASLIAIFDRALARLRVVSTERLKGP